MTKRGVADTNGSSTSSFPCTVDHLALLLCGFIAVIIAVMGVSVTYLTAPRSQPQQKPVDDEKARLKADEENPNLDFAQLAGSELCRELVVKEGKRLQCVVRDVLCRQRQDEIFDVQAVPSSGGEPLFRVRVKEIDEDDPGIYIETLGGKDILAFLSTRPLWSGEKKMELSILRPFGLVWGTVQRSAAGEYVVHRAGGRGPLLRFSGDVAGHSVKFATGSKILGYTQPAAPQTSPAAYQVTCSSESARVDVALVMLALFAMAKCEITPSSRHMHL